jgi:hypothetical protein
MSLDHIAEQRIGASNERDRSHTPRRSQAGAESGDEIESSLGAASRPRRGRQLLTVNQSLAAAAAAAGSTQLPLGTSQLPKEPEENTTDDPMGDRSGSLMHDAIDQAVAEEIEKRKHPEIASHFRKCAQRLAGKIENLQKTNTRIAKAKSDLEAYNQSKIPTGQRAYTPSFETPLLDTLCLEEDYTINFTVKKDTTLREAKRVLHVLNLASQKCMDLMLMERQRSLNKEATSRKAFIEACSAVPETVKANDMFALLDLDDGGITVPDLDKQKLETKALSLYLKTVEAAAKAKTLETENKIKVEKAKVEREAKLAAKPPEKLLEETVKTHVDAQMSAWSKKGKGKGKKQTKPERSTPPPQPPAPKHDNNKTSGPKNGVSPAKGGGKSSDQPKSKGKGKGKPAGKKGAGSGKGSGGKSKGKTKQPARS